MLTDANIPQRNEIDVFEVEALPHPTQLDIEISLNLFERHLFAGITVPQDQVTALREPLPEAA